MMDYDFTELGAVSAPVTSPESDTGSLQPLRATPDELVGAKPSTATAPNHERTRRPQSICKHGWIATAQTIELAFTTCSMISSMCFVSGSVCPSSG